MKKSLFSVVSFIIFTLCCSSYADATIYQKNNLNHIIHFNNDINQLPIIKKSLEKTIETARRRPTRALRLRYKRR